MNSTLITGIIIILAIIVPIWLLMRSQTQGKRKLQKKLAILGKGNALNITESESFGNKVIGLDREGAKVAFSDFTDKEKEVYIADLKLFDHCFVDKKYLTTTYKKAGDVISGIDLNFVASSKGASGLVIPLYDDSRDQTLTNELQIAQEWADKITLIIRNLGKKK